jgi:flagellar hook-basal body complex protein FliE
MSPIAPINPLLSGASALNKIDAPLLPKLPGVHLGGAAGPGPADGFGKMLDGLVASVDAKQTEAQALTQKVLLGDSDQLHQSVIAMQEAGVSFSLMVEVRNKLIESYQELMRMQV